MKNNLPHEIVILFENLVILQCEAIEYKSVAPARVFSHIRVQNYDSG